MSHESPRNPITLKPVVYDMPGTDRVSVRHDVEFRGADGTSLTMDLYRPPDTPAGARTPAVIIVNGYPGPGFQKMLGCQFKDMQSTICWARLIAASGLIAIGYSNREPAADLDALLDDLQRNAASLGIDAQRLGLWTSSGHVPAALGALLQREREYLKCAALCYGFMMDLDGGTGVAQAAARFGFANPTAGKSMDDVPKDRPLFLARAGREHFPGLNDALDRFVTGALARNLPVTFVNHPTGPHGFDLFDDGEISREIVRSVLAFLRCHLLAAAPAGARAS